MLSLPGRKLSLRKELVRVGLRMFDLLPHRCLLDRRIIAACCILVGCIGAPVRPILDMAAPHHTRHAFERAFRPSSRPSAQPCRILRQGEGRMPACTLQLRGGGDAREDGEGADAALPQGAVFALCVPDVCVD